MRCAWQEYLKILPLWMRKDVDELGKDSLQELRMRTGLPPELICNEQSLWLHRNVSAEDLSFVLNTASHYSPWAAETIGKGYITAPGGHRIGICGEAVINKGQMTGIKRPLSLCIRVARDFPGIAKNVSEVAGSVLIIGRPGSGKTTLLRDLIRNYSQRESRSICVVDERGELFPVVQGTSCFPQGRKTDIMTNCSKAHGITALLRTMGPSCIALDEITQQEDCRALLHAAWSGVKLMATAHASCRKDLLSRPVYRPIVSGKLFDTLLIMQPDMSWKEERM